VSIRSKPPRTSGNRSAKSSGRGVEAGQDRRVTAVEIIFLANRPPSPGATVQVQSQRWLESKGFSLPSVYVAQARAAESPRAGSRHRPSTRAWPTAWRGRRIGGPILLVCVRTPGPCRGRHAGRTRIVSRDRMRRSARQRRRCRTKARLLAGSGDCRLKEAGAQQRQALRAGDLEVVHQSRTERLMNRAQV